MAVVNHDAKEVSFKVVYCGTPLGGKTTNLAYIHQQLDGGQRGDLVSLSTSTDRTLFFDFLPIDTFVVNGYKTKFQLYTVPGQVMYNATRQLVLRGVDGIVFVADSDPERLEANGQAFQTMHQNLQDNGTAAGDLPLVFQYNKRDLPNAVPVAYHEQMLNQERRVAFEAAASTGYNVFATLNALAQQVLQRFHAVSSPAPAAAPAPAAVG